jgi:hypothetical protein
LLVGLILYQLNIPRPAFIESRNVGLLCTLDLPLCLTTFLTSTGVSLATSGNGRWFGFHYGDKGSVRLVSGEVVAEDGLLECLALDKLERKEARSEEKMDTVHRKDFLDVLVKLIPPGMAVFGKRLSSITRTTSGSPVILNFKDRSTAMADAVVGCDGIRSVVREHILVSQIFSVPLVEKQATIFSTVGRILFTSFLKYHKLTACLPGKREPSDVFREILL